MDATTQAVTYRRSDPFGNVRGSAPAKWTGDHGFVGGIESDITGLTHLGARDYDPTTGRFVSLDPVLELTDPQQVNGYSYAAGNPVTGADPDGLMNDSSHVGGSGIVCDGYCQADEDLSSYCGAYKSAGSSCDHGSPTPQAVLSGKRQKTSGLSKWLDMFTGSAGKSVMGGIKDFFDGKAEKSAFDTFNDMVACADGVHCEAAVKDTKDSLASLKDAYKQARDGHSAQVLGTLVGALLLAWVTDKVMPDLGIGKKAPGGCSFSPDTQVLMGGGKTEPIGKIKPGEQVEAADPDTGKHKKAEKVTATWINHDDDLVDLTIDTGKGRASVLHTTSQHPFWDDTVRKWLPAAELTPGHALETATDTHVRLAGKAAHPGTVDMYNLTVNELHTYYVLAGTTPVLVHNTDGGICDLNDGYLYRGLAKGHHEYDAAAEGRAVPRGTSTDIDAHSDGNATDTIYTSWSDDPEVAQFGAENLGDDYVGEGVMLRVRVEGIDPSRVIQIHGTQYERFFEDEHLISGEVLADDISTDFGETWSPVRRQ
nr:polymorphic toxin-type HINT domain-containing protein [Streptomyces sp. SN-593]